VGLVCCVSVVSSSTSKGIGGLVRRSDRADLVVVSDAAPGIDPEAVEAIRAAPSVSVVTELGADTFTVNGHSDEFTALDTDTASQTLDLQVRSGTLAGFADGDIAVTSSGARSHHLTIGQYVSTQFGIPQVRYLQVTAIIADNGITRDWVVPFETYRRGDFATPIRTLFVAGIPGPRLLRQVNVGVSGFPGVSVYDAGAYATSQARQAEGPVDLVNVLVGLAILIALLGVADVLGLSVVERRSELGLLVTLGMTPRQLAASVRWESLLASVSGAAVGLVGGLGVGLILTAALHTDGVTALSVPIVRVGAVVILANVAALAAAAWPARRAGQVTGLLLLAG
jgi:putative ABC transport system permease protein